MFGFVWHLPYRVKVDIAFSLAQHIQSIYALSAMSVTRIGHDRIKKIVCGFVCCLSYGLTRYMCVDHRTAHILLSLLHQVNT